MSKGQYTAERKAAAKARQARMDMLIKVEKHCEAQRHTAEADIVASLRRKGYSATLR